MMVSLYSISMAVLWFSIFIVFGTVLQRRTGIVFCHRLFPLLFLLALTIFRLAVPIETAFTQEIQSKILYPAVQTFLRGPLFSFGGLTISGAHLLLGIWVTVAIFLCLRLCFLLLRDKYLLKTFPDTASQNVKQYLKELLSRRDHHRQVKLIVSSQVSTPMLVGLVHPSILLPQECNNMPEQELQYILNHELTHLYNGDLLIKLLIRLLCCTMWWNPCVYLLQMDLNDILEYKCDLTVTKTMKATDKVQYLQTILDVLKRFENEIPRSTQAQTLQACFYGIPETTVLKRRFQLVLDKDDTHRAIPIVFVTSLLLLFVVSYSVVLQPASQPPATDLAGKVFITPETSYILASSDGTYYLVYNGMKCETLPSEILQESPYCLLPIQYETKEN